MLPRVPKPNLIDHHACSHIEKFVHAGNRGCHIVGLRKVDLPFLTLGAICSLGLTRGWSHRCVGMEVR